MKINFDQLETRLQSLIEGGIARFFPVGIDQKNLGAQLVSEMRANLQVQPDNTPLAPNLFLLSLHPAHALILAENQASLDELAGLLQKAAGEAGIQFPASPQLRVIPNPEVSLGETRILAQFHLEHLVDTSTLTPQPSIEREGVLNAFLIVNGSQVFPLNGAVVNLGRNTENHLVISDLRISRFHAQLRTIRGRYVIFDLDSTGGTYVNGKRVTQYVLHPGDVISLAGVPVIYGQDSSSISDETQDLPASFI